MPLTLGAWSRAASFPRVLALLLLLATAGLRADPPKDHNAAISAASRGVFPGVFIQQEHEGNLVVGASPEDSWGSVFNYYRPREIDTALLEEAARGLWWPDRTLFWLRRKTLNRGDPWSALPTYGKLRYLELQERKLTQAGGESACWNGAECRLLVRRSDAPRWIADHPHMERYGFSGNTLSDRKFHFPEIITRRDAPALTAEQAMARARQVIADTGHAGVHFHVFVRLPPEQLRARLPYLTNALHLANDSFFLQSAAGNYDNALNARLAPWTDDKSRRVREIVEAGLPTPHVPNWDDPNDPKTSHLAFRYWGVEDGQAVISLELRGVDLPWVVEKRLGDEGTVPRKYRNYAPAERALAQVVLLAQGLTRAEVPELRPTRRALDIEAAQRRVEARASARGIPSDRLMTLREFSRLIHGTDAVPAGFLLPFDASGPETPHQRALIDAFLTLSEQAKRQRSAPDYAVTYRYEFWTHYRDWATAEIGKQRGELFRAYPALLTGPAISSCNDALTQVRAR